MKSFKELGIEEPLLKVIEQMGFKEPTEIQEKAIPLVVQGKDIIAGSATGSGKTLAFGVGIVQSSQKNRGVQALVLTPTRELAEQVGGEMKKFSKNHALGIAIIYGGVSISPQIEKLKKAEVVVGTPGRILDHLQRGTIDLGGIKTLVLDEADRMLDMGFIDDIRKIISRCNRHRQTMLFSATIMPEIKRLADSYMKNPIKVSAVSYVDPRKLTQVYYNISEKLKFSLLVHLLKNEHSRLIMIFCNSRNSVDFVANNLRANGIAAQAIHAGFPQQKRTSIMEMFHSQKVNVLVCTDVAARGLDIKGVSHIYNYDIPKDSKQYIHRIGRTARAGKEGKAINLLSTRDYDNFDRVLRDNDVNVKKMELPLIKSVHIKWMSRPAGRAHGRIAGAQQKYFKQDHKNRHRRY